MQAAAALEALPNGPDTEGITVLFQGANAVPIVRFSEVAEMPDEGAAESTSGGGAVASDANEDGTAGGTTADDGAGGEISGALLGAAGIGAPSEETMSLAASRSAANPGGNTSLVWVGTDADDPILGSNYDLLFGAGGNDVILGRVASDALFGGDGDDVIAGGEDNDEVFGEAGNDRLFGGIDDDLVVGGAGNNVIWGNDGDDRLLGGSDSDALIGGEGQDRMFGGGGADAFIYDDNSGRDIIADFEVGVDKLVMPTQINGLRLTPEEVIERTGTNADGYAVVNLGGNTVTLLGVTVDELSPDDIVLVA